MALEVLIEPAQRSWRNPVLDPFFRHFGQFASAGHTTRLQQRKLQFAQYMCQLLKNRQRRRDPNGRDNSVPQQSSLHQDAVGRQQSCFEPNRFANGGIIADVRRPVTFVPSRAQPTGKAPQSGVAEEARVSRSLGFRRTASRAKCLYLVAQSLIDLFKGPLGRNPKRSTEAFGLMGQPGERLIRPARANLPEECAKFSFVCLPNPAHWQRAQDLRDSAGTISSCSFSE